ncbi:unnamed protein product [Prorocentrum cordatum]|uniref:Deacetylase sirtuin-type domain-containing protein n=1 Tax=Prorocentrum cordatum TaxID=2364126 RepID=A0ABN9QHB4_9DINO|nr:unnamed protein product [Polarella glacialis]
MAAEGARSSGPPHGALLRGAGLAPARLVAACAEEARPGFASERADEFLDTPASLAAKVEVLARLMRQSRHCVAYTGAGLSTAAGIGDYASRAAGSLGAPADPRPERDWPALQPTAGHRALEAMRAAGLLHGWVQQNHDGLPQRAGVPQAFVNEIHGSWFDPANPTVGFGEPLREDLFAALLAEELKCDLCLALGTSLCDTPSTADRIAVTPALRSHWETPAEQIGEKALGLAVVSLQRTRLDPLAAVRVYAPLDEVLEALATALGLALPDADAVDTAPDVAAFDAAPGAAADAATRLRPGDEAVVAAGPDRGNVLRAVRRTQLGDLELSLAGAPGSPPRRALLGSWWLGRGSGPPPALLPPGAEVPPQRTLASLLPLLPPWAAAALGLPCAAGSARRSPVELGPDAGLAVEGLWEATPFGAPKLAPATRGKRRKLWTP